MRDGNGGGNGDYIPLKDSADRSPRRDGPRLAREGDSGDDDDEGRISFTSKHDPKAGYSRTVGQGGRGDDRDDDEEEDGHVDWEEQQIRKAMRGATLSAGDQAYYTESSGFHMGNGSNLMLKQDSKTKAAFGGAAGLKAPVSYNLQGIKDRLKMR